MDQSKNLSETITTPCGVNRQGRRAKVNFKTKGGKRARTATPVAKRPTVEILTISNVPSDILEAIDEIAARQDHIRSSFVRCELKRIVAESQAKETGSKLR